MRPLGEDTGWSLGLCMGKCYAAPAFFRLFRDLARGIDHVFRGGVQADEKRFGRLRGAFQDVFAVARADVQMHARKRGSFFLKGVCVHRRARLPE